MAIASPSAPSFSASFRCTRTEPIPMVRFSTVRSHRTPYPARRLVLSSRLNASTPSNGSVSPDNGEDLQDYELQHKFSTNRRREGSPVFVTLPLDAVESTTGQLRRRKTMAVSFRALAMAGVEGVVMEVWWGLVERNSPKVYNWQGYLDIVSLAARCGLKVRAVMAFHQCGRPGDPFWIPLPRWVLEEIHKDPDLTYSDSSGRNNREYISLGCDTLPVLHGRSPIQAYADFMRNFRDTFGPFLGGVITGIQIGMGPAGELRYPATPPHQPTRPWRYHELGEFQCYDKYMLASLDAEARGIGMREWAHWGPFGTGSLTQDPEHTEFFKTFGSWNTPYGEFFLEWYSGLLLSHGERICREAETIFRGTEVKLYAKVAGVHWHYNTPSHPSELTAGYYNTSIRDGYLPIARMFGRYGFTMCCKCLEMKDSQEQQMNLMSGPEGFLRQLILSARVCSVPFECENSVTMNDDSFKQVLKIAKETPSFSFNFVRMDKNMFDNRNWVSFTRFVRQMSEANTLRVKLDFGGGDVYVSFSASASAMGNVGVVLAC